MTDYADDGNRERDPRHGFGDDMGTRIGRPDGAQPAPHDASGVQRPGPSTNADTMGDDLEGSILDDDGPNQRRVRDASDSVNPDRDLGDDRRVDDL